MTRDARHASQQFLSRLTLICPHDQALELLTGLVKLNSKRAQLACSAHDMTKAPRHPLFQLRILDENNLVFIFRSEPDTESLRIGVRRARNHTNSQPECALLVF